MADTALVSVEINVAAVESLVAGPTNGAVCSFVGQVRRHSRGRDVVFLEYEAYVPMAEKTLLRIALEAEERWGCQVAIRHRIGKIEVGETSVVVAVGAPHRAETFDACRYCIDTLKERVPIWKRETCPDGTFWIEGDRERPAEERG